MNTAIRKKHIVALLINIILSKIIGEPVIDIWDILSVFILLIVAAAFIIVDYARRKGYVR